MSLPPFRVCITGAAGQIAYSLLPHICLGRTFGTDRPIILHLLDIDRAQQALNGVKMELEDCGFDLLQDVVVTSDANVAFKGIDICIMLGAFPRGPGMERKDLLAKNCAIFKAQGRLLDEVASKNVKVVVVGNPANTNCWVAQQSAPSIPKENFTALTRLDANRAQSQIAMRLRVPPSAVQGCTIWGNHSSTQYPSVNHAVVKQGAGGDKKVVDLVQDSAWLHGGYITTVQQRGAAIINARKLSSAMSAAKAISDHMHDFVMGSSGRVVSMAVPSDGSYGVEKGLIYSFPVLCAGGKYTIVPGLQIDSFSDKMMQATMKELQEERDAAKAFLFGEMGQIARSKL